MTTMHAGFPVRSARSALREGGRRASPAHPSGLLQAAAERFVARLVGDLGPQWSLLPDGCARSCVLVGPPGAFLLAPRWYVGRRVWVGGDMFLVGGVKRDDVAAVRAEAARAAVRLTVAAGVPVQVTGVLAVLSEQRTIRSQPSGGDVLVLAPRSVQGHLRSLPVDGPPA